MGQPNKKAKKDYICQAVDVVNEGEDKGGEHHTQSCGERSQTEHVVQNCNTDSENDIRDSAREKDRN